MSKYLKLFETTSDYKAYINGGGVVLPNVSVAKDAPKTVYFNPIPPPFFAKLSLNNGEVVELQGSGELTSAMVSPYKSSVVSAEIGKLCTSIGQNVFNSCTGLTSVTIGSGVTSIGDGAFRSTGLTSITIPDSVTSIGQQIFVNCTGLTSVTIGSGVTSIGDSANKSMFYGCTSLTSITSLATTAPTINNYTFEEVKTGGTLTVPSGSTGYDVWMGTGRFYLGSLGWTKVEQ